MSARLLSSGVGTFIFNCHKYCNRTFVCCQCLVEYFPAFEEYYFLWTDIFFRPFIRTPLQGAATAIGLLLDAEVEGRTATFNLNNHCRLLPEKYTRPDRRAQLWEETERILSEKGFLPINDKR